MTTVNDFEKVRAAFSTYWFHWSQLYEERDIENNGTYIRIQNLSRDISTLLRTIPTLPVRRRVRREVTQPPIQRYIRASGVGSGRNARRYTTPPKQTSSRVVRSPCTPKAGDTRTRWRTHVPPPPGSVSHDTHTCVNPDPLHQITE